MDETFKNITGFEWDKGNQSKNWLKHKVSKGECEQAFFNEPVVVHHDVKHSVVEKRWFLLGRTDIDRLLFIVFTIRDHRIRVFSARDMNKKEREMYYESA